MAKYCEYSKYEQYRIPEYFKYRQYSRVSNHKILEVQAVSRVFKPEIMRVLAVSRSTQKPKYCEVHEVPEAFSLKNTFTPRYSEHLCNNTRITTNFASTSTKNTQGRDSRFENAQRAEWHERFAQWCPRLYPMYCMYSVYNHTEDSCRQPTSLKNTVIFTGSYRAHGRSTNTTTATYLGSPQSQKVTFGNSC